MASITLTMPTSGTVITAALHANNYAAIQTAVDGGLDNTNIAGGAAIAQSKIAFDAWQAYTPAWTASGVAPVLNNGTLTGKYVQLGKTVHGRAALTIGSTTTTGTGTYSFSLPVTGAAAEVGPIGTSLAVDTGIASYIGTTIYNSSTTVVIYAVGSPIAGAWTNAAPFAFGNTDTMVVRFTYEAA